MIYRLAVSRDHIGLMILDRLCFDKPIPGIQWFDYLETNVVHVMASAGQVLGYVVSRQTSKGIRIVRFAVHPEHRKTGIGSRLLETVVISAPAAHVYTIVHEDVVFDGLGKFLNKNNFEALHYVNKHRTKIQFSHTGCHPQQAPGVRRRPCPAIVG